MLLVGDEAHAGFEGRRLHVWPVEGGALILLQEVRGDRTRFARIDAKGRLSFEKIR